MTTARHTPMVSVAMIAYNKADVIGDAIEGVVNQITDFGIELIVVDDASTDSTWSTILQWQERYPLIVKPFRNKANKGLQGNYLEAFKHCRGKYMAICDADDYWISTDKLATQIGYMESHPDCAITFHRVVNLYEANGTMSLSNGGQKTECTIADLSRSNFITNLAVVYRRELVDLTDLPSWILDDRSPDYAMHMLYAAKGSIHYFKKPMGLYRIASGSAWSMTERYKKLAMSLTVREHLMRQFADDAIVVAGLREASTNILLNMVCAAADNTERRNFAIEKLLRLGAYDSAEAIERKVDSLLKSKPTLKKRLMSAAREAVSRLLPVPRPAHS